MGCLKLKGVKHDWRVIQEPTNENFPGNPWQRVECKRCHKEMIEQPPVTLINPSEG